MDTTNVLKHQIIIQFKSMKDLDVAYDLLLNDFLETVKVSEDKTKLQETRLRLLDRLAEVENQLGKLAHPNLRNHTALPLW